MRLQRFACRWSRNALTAVSRDVGWLWLSQRSRTTQQMSSGHSPLSQDWVAPQTGHATATHNHQLHFTMHQTWLGYWSHISTVFAKSESQDWRRPKYEISKSQNEKSELLLMIRARAYSRSCSQEILVYLHPFRRNSFFFSQKSPKITKTHIFRVWGHSRSSMLTFLRSSSPVLVMISSMSVPICNHFHAI